MDLVSDNRGIIFPPVSPQKLTASDQSLTVRPAAVDPVVADSVVVAVAAAVVAAGDKFHVILHLETIACSL
jgi:hypothetical protein